ncbi:hypothetical protein Micbo1qcDRAFT_178013 [Microdochium bolleyi]|uniref:RBR-type E3 ubiquitin transferase n=1 Tax=Microdochium bolleyi TaxID=196109 RepID=A0A136ITW7_9PEZI|nr:hypothetical protein Micbo1qcDRAFT_178013 [Microdochium bolleyi]
MASLSTGTRWSCDQQDSPHHALSRTQPLATTRGRRYSMWCKITEGLERARARRRTDGPGARKHHATKRTGYEATSESPVPDDSPPRDSHPIGRIVTLRAKSTLALRDDGSDLQSIPVSSGGPRPREADARNVARGESSDTGDLSRETRQGYASASVSQPQHSSTPMRQDYAGKSCHSSLALAGAISGDTTINSPRNNRRRLSLRNDGLGMLIEITRTRSQKSGHTGAPSPENKTGSRQDIPVVPVTLRDVLMKKIISAQQRRRTTPSVSGETTPTSSERPLTPSQTRELLQAIEAIARNGGRDLSTLETRQEPMLAMCAVCSTPQFRTPHEPDTADTIEGIIGPALGTTMDCCGSYLCRGCLGETFCNVIQKGWWRDISLDNAGEQGGGWLRCPLSDCGADLPLTCSNIRARLQSCLGVADIEPLVRMLEQAERLRTALRKLTPRPTEREVHRARRMHNKLVKLGCAWPLFDGDNTAPLSNATATSPADTDIRVERVAVDYLGSKATSTSSDNGSAAHATTQRIYLPVFMHSLRIPRVHKECIICTEIYHDFASGIIPPSLQERNAGEQPSQGLTEDEHSRRDNAWREAILRYPGDWSWQIFAFPPAHILPACSPSIPSGQGRRSTAQGEVCRTCLDRYIGAQLDVLGIRVTERGISCPLPACSRGRSKHVLTFDEVRRLSSPETFSRYDRFMTLGVCTECRRDRCLQYLPLAQANTGRRTEAVSSLPPLPLPPRTSSANIVRTEAARVDSDISHQRSLQESQRPTDHTNNRITCHACRFTMCYTCQTPWHTGLTCAQARTLRDNHGGDPDPLRTKSWLDAHTKRCPNLRCGIALQKGEGCFHMTCPACAAQFCWECLADWSGIVVEGRFNREGHGEGCYFRGENAVPPTQIMGRTVERGLRRTRGLFNLR